jgi:capsular polysaccharide biosynthesis protein
LNRRHAFDPENVRPLSPSEFAFHGFGEALAGIEQRIGGASIRGGEPRVETVEDAVFVPSEHHRVKGQSQAYGGIVAADGQPVEAAQVRRKGRTPRRELAAPVAVDPRRELDETVVYLGPLFNHFGRLLLESLARVWFLAEADPALRVVFDHPNTGLRTRTPWVMRILDAFGIPAERILLLETPTRLRRVLVPEALFEQMHAAHVAMTGPFREVVTRIAGDCGRADQPVYLSRRLLTSRQRPIVGEAELEDVLRENGFLVTHPETMTFADQVRLVNRHAHVFSSVGSAAHSILFARQRPELHLLTTPEHTSANYFLCSALAEAADDLRRLPRHRPPAELQLRAGRGEGGRRGSGEGATAVGSGRQATPQLVEMPKVLAYLDERGFLARRLRSSLAGRNPGIRECYDEAWLFGRVRKAAAKQGLGLPAEVKAEAVEASRASWPVCAVLARYYAWSVRDPERAEDLAHRFVELVAAESDMNRLAHYRSEVVGMVIRVAAVCRNDVATRLAEVVGERFGRETVGDDDEADDETLARVIRRASRQEGRRRDRRGPNLAPETV